jgi:excisionase family DNA binding protein
VVTVRAMTTTTPDHPTTHADRGAAPDPTESTREWFSIETLADHLEVSPSTLYKWVSKGDFPSYARLPNNQIRVHRDDLDVWMARRRIT